MESAPKPRRVDRGQAVVVLLAVFAGLLAAMAGSPRSNEPPVATLDVDVSAPVGSTPPARVLLLAHAGPKGIVDALAVFGFENETSGAALLIPPSTLLEVPSLGAQTLADTIALGSVDLLELAVENLLGLAIDDAVVLDDAEVALAFAPASEVDIDLSRAVRIDDADGPIALSSGPQAVDARTAARLLIAPVAPDDQLEQQLVVRSVLEGWRTAMSDPEIGDQIRFVDVGLHSLVDQSAATLRYDTLPVDAISVGGSTRYSVRRADAADLIAREFAFAVLNDGAPRPRVEILNGSGAVRVTPRVAQVVIPNGGEVTHTDNVPGFGVTESQIQYQDEADAEAAHRLAEALGIVRVAPAPQPVDVVDVSIVVGADFAPAP